MTPRQLQVLLFIQQFIAEHGYSPSFEEIATAIKTKSRGQARALVHALSKRGYISYISNRARTIMVLRPITERYEVHVFNDVTKALEPYAPNHLEAAE